MGELPRYILLRKIGNMFLRIIVGYLTIYIVMSTLLFYLADVSILGCACSYSSFAGRLGHKIQFEYGMLCGDPSRARNLTKFIIRERMYTIEEYDDHMNIIFRMDIDTMFDCKLYDTDCIGNSFISYNAVMVTVPLKNIFDYDIWDIQFSSQRNGTYMFNKFDNDPYHYL